MQALKELALVSVDEYLAGEPLSDVRHEYIGGRVYAMAGASEDHNTICLNLALAIRSHLRGKPCRTFMADLKVRLEIAGQDIFYYPDVLVTSDPRDTDRFSKRYPKILIEVLSESTDHTDRREKFLSYIRIETLEEYLLVAQDRMEITLFRRAANWRPELLRQAGEFLKLSSIEFSLPLSAVYEGVKV
jgi:Uma2 family endonuclease